MEDILASIRRILNEDETPPPAPSAAPPGEVLVLDSSMMVPDEPAQPEMVPAETQPQETLVQQPNEHPTPPAPPGAALARPDPPPIAPAAAPRAASPASPQLVAPEAAAAAASAVGALVRTLAERGVTVSRGGPSLEDIVRDEMRPLLKQWLDAHLPEMVERVVRAELDRVMNRAVP